MLAQFGSLRSEATERYQSFVLAGIDARPHSLPALRALPASAAGTPEFVEAALAHGCDAADGTDLTEVPRANRRPPAPTLAEVQARFTDRVEAMAHAYATGGYTMRAIGMHFGVHRTTVAKAVRNHELRQSPGTDLGSACGTKCVKVTSIDLTPSPRLDPKASA
jgi:transposase-like protein